MKKHSVFSIFFVVGILCHVQALADETLTLALFESCDAAKAKLVDLEQEGGDNPFPLLVRVLTLNTQAPNVAEAFAALPGVTRNKDFGPPLWWQTVDAKRELSAKRCALELLEQGGDRAFLSLGALEEVYSQQSLSDEVAVGLEEVIVEIAERAHLEGMIPSEADIDAMIEHLDSPHPLVAENILQEFFDPILPQLLRKLATSSPEVSGRVLRIIRESDPDGGAALMPLLLRPSLLPAEDTARVASMLIPPEKETFRELADSLAEAIGWSEPQETQHFAKLLGKGCVALGKVELSEESARALATKIEILGVDYLPLESQECLVGSVPELAHAVPELLTEESESNVGHFAQLLYAAFPYLDGTARREAYVRLRDLALSDQVAAIGPVVRVLGLFEDHRADTLRTLQQLVKGPRIRPETERTAVTRAAVVTGLLGMGRFSETKKFGSFLLEMLREGTEVDAVTRLLGQADSSIERDLIAIIRTASVPERLRALAVLRVRPEWEKGTIVALVEQLEAGDLSQEVEAVLAARAPSGLNEVKKALSKYSSPASLPVLLTSRAFGLASVTQRAELIGFLSGLSCEGLSDRSAVALQSIVDADLEEAPRQQLAKALVACLAQVSPESGKAWVNTIPLVWIVGSEEFQRTVADPKLNGEVVHVLLSVLQASNLEQAVGTRFVISLLENAAREVKLAALLSSAPTNGDAPELASVVRSIVNSSADDRDLQSAALLWLALGKDPEYDWKAMIDRTLDAAANEPLEGRMVEVVRAAPREMVVREVMYALGTSSVERRLGAVRVAAVLGTEALSVLNRLWELREDDSPSIRYSAVLALLEIDPLTPAVREQVRRMLVNRFFNDALQTRVEWHRTVAVATLDRSAFGTLRQQRLDALMRS